MSASPAADEPLVHRLGIGDHREIDRAPALDAQALEHRRRLGGDRVLPVAEVGDLRERRVDPEPARLDRLTQPASPKVVPEAVQVREALLAELLLGLQLVGEHARLAQLALDVVEPLAARPFEDRQLLLALAVLLLAGQLAREVLEPARRRAPHGAQLEIGQALVAFVRSAEVLLEGSELLLDAHGCAFLQLEAVEQAMALVVERAQFLLQLGAIAEQRDQPLVLGRHALPRQPTGQAAQAVRSGHA